MGIFSSGPPEGGNAEADIHDEVTFDDPESGMKETMTMDIKLEGQNQDVVEAIQGLKGAGDEGAAMDDPGKPSRMRA